MTLWHPVAPCARAQYDCKVQLRVNVPAAALCPRLPGPAPPPPPPPSTPPSICKFQTSHKYRIRRSRSLLTRLALKSIRKIRCQQPGTVWGSVEEFTSELCGTPIWGVPALRNSRPPLRSGLASILIGKAGSVLDVAWAVRGRRMLQKLFPPSAAPGSGARTFRRQA